MMLSVAQSRDEDGDENRYAVHDVALAVSSLTFQATALGLAVHQMGGFRRKRARETFGISEDYRPVTALAVGYPGDPTDLPEGLRERELA